MNTLVSLGEVPPGQLERKARSLVSPYPPLATIRRRVYLLDPD